MPLVFFKTARVTTENTQVDVNQQFFVIILRNAVMRGGTDQLADALADFHRQRRRIQTGTRPAGAVLLIIPGAHVIDGIMKPDGQFHLGRTLAQMADLIKAGKTFTDMLQGVIVPVRLRIAVQNALI